MAITTNSAIEFFGTQDTITGSGGTVVNGAFGAAATTWTNDDDAPMASVILSASFTTAPTANTSVNLYLRPLNIQSTNDGDVPDANFGHVYVGSFPLNDVTTQQYIAIDIRLPNTKTSQEYDFYIENNGGQTIDYDWTLYITPKTIGPHA
ncbi:MAG: hypothetical protein KDK71_10190 [Chlamydiia bacterium]|nr:hypothetical protein [Chlamydiia bacterium]